MQIYLILMLFDGQNGRSRWFQNNWCYHKAPRPLGNAIAYLNSAFLAQMSLDGISGKFITDDIKLAFGAFGEKHAIRAREVEKYLVGKSITVSVILGAVRLIRQIISPVGGTTHTEYRKSLAVSFLFKFLEPLLNGTGKDVSVATFDGASGSNNDDNCFHSEFYPVGEPMKKVGVEIQASAVYVDDIPTPKDCLYGAFINSTKPLAHIKIIEFRSTPSSQKIMEFISVNDIPKGGLNIGSGSIFGNEAMFANSVTEYAGQPLGVVIAGTQRFANMGAKQVTVNYNTENLEASILTIEEAVKRSSFFPIPESLKPKQFGDFSKGIEEADQIITSEIKLESQYFFYLEPQTALAIPDEDNSIVVYSSCQGPDSTQHIIAKCLGIPNHNVRVITRRVGGAFGGKSFRSMPDVDLFEDVTDQDIRMAIQNATGPRTSLFVPEVPFEILVRRQIARLLDPSILCARFIYDELIKLSHKCLPNELQQFPILRKCMDDVVGKFLRVDSKNQVNKESHEIINSVSL